MNKLDKIIDISGWVALFVFLAVLAVAFIQTKDPILLILGLFFFGAGMSVKQSNAEFGRAIERYKDQGEKTIQALDDAIAAEKRKCAS